MKNHSVEWTLDNDWVQGVIRCTAPEGAWCRMTCPSSCEDTTNCDHELVDNGACLAVEWIDNECSLEEAYRGPKTKPADGLVAVSWNGEFWEWCYLTDLPTGPEDSA